MLMTQFKQIKNYKAKGKSISEIAKAMNIPYYKVWTILNRLKVRKYQRDYHREHPEKQQAWVDKNRSEWNKYMRERMRKQKK